MSTIEPHKYELQLNQYRQIFDHCIDVIYMVEVTPDGDFIYVDVNTAYTKVTGIPREEVIGLNVEKIQNNAFRSILIEKFTSCLNAGEQTDYINNYPFPSGIISFHSVLTPLFDENGRIHKIVGIARDITERKRAEETLHEREWKFRSLADNTPDNIVRWDSDGRYLYINPVHEQTLGKTASEIIGTFVPDNYNEVQTAITQVAITGEPITVMQTVTSKDGGIEYHDVIITPERDTSGSIISVLGIGRDITERMRIENELLASEAKYRTFFESANDGIFLHRIVEQNGTVEFILHDLNQRGCVLWDHSREDILSGNLDLLTIGEHPYTFEEATKRNRLAANGEPQLFDWQIKHKNGSIIWVEVNLRRIQIGNEPFLLAIIRDITERKREEKALLKAMEFNEEIINTIPDLLFELDAEGTYLNIWAQDEALLAAQKAVLIGKNIRDVLPSDAIEVCFQTIREVDETGQSLGNTIYIDFPEGKKHFELSASKKKSSGTYIVLSRDITERKQMEQLLLKNESRLKEAQKIAKIGSWELQFPRLELSWSDEIYRIFEIIPSDEAPQYSDFINIIHPDDRDLVDLAYQQSLNNKTPYEITHRLRMNDGRIKYVHEKGETFYDAQGNPLRSIGTAQDVTEQKMVEKKIEYMAHHDALTGLPNRILSKERTQQAIAYAKSKNSKMAFLFIDLDGFKNINDSMGHSAGDTMLKIVAQRLREIVKVSDTISRQGGDEFLITLSDVNDRSDIIVVADRLLEKLDESFYINEQILSTSASIGIAVYPENGDTFESLLQNADAAMYAAKASGKNAYSFYTKQMSNNLIKQFKIQNDLKSALENNEFILHYQPQIDLATNQITGAEALIRWNHPQLGMVPPLNFIPIAESSGMIVSIGEWVIMEACRQASLWHKQGWEITIAVNISAVQFKRGNLEEVVKNTLRLSGLHPQFLELELTESILIHDSENILLAVHALKALGIKLSIDDFGTGYSSLSYLKRFAVDKLKIDQSFVRDILRDQEDAAIVQTIIQMAKNLNLKTIAEGVEDKNVLAVIESYGCDEVQGYHFAKSRSVSLN